MIGVFDSGSGGLTVFHELVRAFPGTDWTYLGDHAAAPYGTRRAADIYERTTRHTHALMQRGARLVLLACNTASAVALRRMQENWLPVHWPDNRVLGVLVPLVEHVTGLAWDRERPGQSRMPARTIGIFGTPRTVESGAYSHEIARRAPQATVLQQACPGLVDLIEAGVPRDDLESAVRRFADDLQFAANGRPVDSVILACTHYPLIEDVFRDVLPGETGILSQPRIVTKAMRAYLLRHPEFAGPGKAMGTVRYLTTGRAGMLTRFDRLMTGANAQYEMI